MSDTIDPKDPIGNWRFEVSVDSKLALGSLAASAEKPFSLKDHLVLFGKALANGRGCLGCDFVLLEDGSLIAQAPLAMLPSYVLEIGLMDAFNLGSLSRLDQEISARKLRKSSELWCVMGYLRGNAKHSENLVLDPRGNLYFHDRRKSWQSAQHRVSTPLP